MNTLIGWFSSLPARDRIRKCKHLPLYHNFREMYWEDVDNLSLTDQQNQDLGSGVFPWEDFHRPLPRQAQSLGIIPQLTLMVVPMEEKVVNTIRGLFKTPRDKVLQANKLQWEKDQTRLDKLTSAGIEAGVKELAFLGRWITQIFLVGAEGVPYYGQGHDRVILALYADFLDEDHPADGDETKRNYACLFLRRLFVALEVLHGGPTGDPAHYLMLLPGCTSTIVHHEDAGGHLDYYPLFTNIAGRLQQYSKTDPIELAGSIMNLQLRMNQSETLSNVVEKLKAHDIHAPVVRKCLLYRHASSQRHRKYRGRSRSGVRTSRTKGRPYRAGDRGSRTRGSRGLRRSNTSAGSGRRRSRSRRRRRS